MREKLNAISEAVIGAAIAVHRELGPGLLETAYEACLEFELIDRGFAVERQRVLPVQYRGVTVDCGFRLDLCVNELVIVELKAVEKLERIHEAQVNTYLRLTGLHLGLLMNFNVTKMVDGIKRIVREFPESSH
ncbi:GxxExxY protein [Gemmata sp. JC673]|uniref:GxxExxY protein n=1 Tax=Gemmata algarum TaxID=2975278 RepID=A0ABU5EUT5_9BACT|nr:GxxExxY protein [Gemmata algarum]MDY3558999.1 GxxExxY protein [Gemmata algarum]